MFKHNYLTYNYLKGGAKHLFMSVKKTCSKLPIRIKLRKGSVNCKYFYIYIIDLILERIGTLIYSYIIHTSGDS